MNPTLRKRLRKTLLGVRPKTVQGQFVFSVGGSDASTVPVPGKVETEASKFQEFRRENGVACGYSNVKPAFNMGWNVLVRYAFWHVLVRN